MTSVFTGLFRLKREDDFIFSGNTKNFLRQLYQSRLWLNEFFIIMMRDAVCSLRANLFRKNSNVIYSKSAEDFFTSILWCRSILRFIDNGGCGAHIQFFGFGIR